MLNKLFLSIVFFVVSIFLSGNLYAQAPEMFSDEDREQLQKDLKMNPDDARLTPEEEQMLADSLKKMTYLFQRFQHVLSLKKDILWGDALAAKIEAFEDTTFVYIYPSAGYEGKGVLPALINRFGNTFDEAPLSPSVQVLWTIVPQQDQQMPFSLEASIDGGDPFSEETFTPILNRMRPFYQNKIYQNIDEAGPDILAAMEVFLEDFAKVVGTRFAPKYLISVDGTELSNGKSIQFMTEENTSDTLILLELIDRVEGSVVTSEVHWKGVSYFTGPRAWLSKRSIANYAVRATVEKDTVSITIQVWDDDLRQQLESLIWLALDEVFEAMKDDLEKKIKDNETELATLSAERKNERAKIVGQYASIMGEKSSSGNTALLIPDQQVLVASSAPDWEQYDLYKKYMRQTKEYKTKLALVNFLQQNKEALAKLAQGDNMKTFKANLAAHIGTLSADVIIKLLQGDKDGLKNFLTEYITKELQNSTR